MKVLWISNLYPNSVSPDRATFNRQQVEALAQHEGVQFRVVAPIAWTDRLQAWRRRKSIEPLNAGIGHPTFWYPPKIMRGQYGRFFQMSIAAAVRNATKDFRPDVIVGSWAYPDGYAALQFGQRKRIPVLIKVHGSDVHSLDDAIRIQRTAEVLRGCNGVLSVSEDLKRRMGGLDVDSDKIRVIYNGVDHKRFFARDQQQCRRELNLDMTEAEKLVLYVGNLKPIKGLDLLLRGFAEAKPVESGARLAIVGGGAEAAGLASLAKELGVMDRVSFPGPAGHDEIPIWLGACNTFALCSANEGVPNVLLEAMAAGRPCVASAVGGIPEVVTVGQTGLLFDDRQPGDVAAKLREAWQTSWDSHEICAASERFSWDRNALETRSFLDDITAQGDGSAAT